MRALAMIVALTTAVFAHGSAQADTRAACVTACEATAQTCLSTAHGTYDACKPAARKTCAPKPPSELFACLTSTLKDCTKNHSTGSEACRTTFDTCYAACGAHPSEVAEFWCTLDADDPASNGKVRKEAVCSGQPGQSPADQHTYCMKQFTPTDPTMGYALDCDPLK